VGDVNNAVDTDTGFGAVGYEYKIAKNETTIAQYATFLNAVAKTDTYALYSTSMINSSINGISRSGVSGSYTYTVNPGSGNKPITYVNWFDAARFANWMHNGQPEGAQDALSTENGAYPLLGKTSGIVAKNSGAKVWIPSENEWYKAAYYDPNKGGAGVGGYWLHANRSAVMTSNTIGVAGASNHLNTDGYAVYTGGISWGITDVGAYGTNSESAYGTNDQAGNVTKWSDGVSDDLPWRVIRGGAWDYHSDSLSSTQSREEAPTSAQIFNLGFRVASSLP
jgi:formylglycine-generating enzyme required for sulfatase activity